MLESILLSALISGYAPTTTIYGDELQEAAVAMMLFNAVTDEPIAAQWVRPGSYFEFIPPTEYGSYEVRVQRMLYVWAENRVWVTKQSPTYICGACHD